MVECKTPEQATTTSHPRWRRVVGWVALGGSTAITCFWAMWGIIENFHEGWYQESALANLQLMLGQYLSPMLGFLALGVVSICWPKVGAAGHLLLAVGAASFFRNSPAATTLIVLPLFALAVFYLIALFPKKRLPLSLITGSTFITLLVAGAEPAWRVANRFDDGDRGARLIECDESWLVWAPRGPGWPDSGTTWDEANSICARLGADGMTLHEAPVHLWRLPTPSEMAAAQHRGNEPCGGEYDAESQSARYRLTPDKESPLWNLHTQVIYLWTAESIDESTALMMAYDGKFWPRPRSANYGYLGFRAVRPATADEIAGSAIQ